jgi:leucyl/phenylalanyl-tRNA--protein transferase
VKVLYAKQLRSFPPPEMTLAEGILDVSDDLRVERLLEAYSFGIFPWPHPDLPTVWYCPEQRGILDFKAFHVPKSLKKFLSRSKWTYTFDQAFPEVLKACAEQPRPGQDGTWITKKMLKAYRDFHKAGYAHSLEVWDGEELIGGLYGVYVGGLFCGESMFHRRTNASKCALVKLVGFLKEQGLEWMDIQMVTPLSEAFGGKYITRGDFLVRLRGLRKTARDIEFQL